MKRRTTLRKIIALTLAVLLILGMVPLAAAIESTGITPLSDVFVSDFAGLQAEIADFATATDDMTITVTAPITVTTPLTIPANGGGHTLTITGEQLTRGVSGPLITVPSGAVLSLANITIDGASGAFADTADAAIVRVGGTFVMNDAQRYKTICVTIGCLSAAV